MRMGRWVVHRKSVPLDDGCGKNCNSRLRVGVSELDRETFAFRLTVADCAKVRPQRLKPLVLRGSTAWLKPCPFRALREPTLSMNRVTPGFLLRSVLLKRGPDGRAVVAFVRHVDVTLPAELRRGRGSLTGDGVVTRVIRTICEKVSCIESTSAITRDRVRRGRGEDRHHVLVVASGTE